MSEFQYICICGNDTFDYLGFHVDGYNGTTMKGRCTKCGKLQKIPNRHLASIELIDKKDGSVMRVEV